jgi:hypothetical protein
MAGRVASHWKCRKRSARVLSPEAGIRRWRSALVLEPIFVHHVVRKVPGFQLNEPLFARTLGSLVESTAILSEVSAREGLEA